MNKIFLLFTILLSSGVSFASNENCNCRLTEFVESYIETNSFSVQDSTQQKILTSKELITVRNKLCVCIVHASNVGFDSNKFRKIIFDALDLSPDVEDSDQIISNFLNKYNSKLICPKEKADHTARDLHLYKIILDNGNWDDFYDFLLDEDKYKIDLNAYEIISGKKETLVDYIENMISTDRYDNEDLELLRDDIIELGGKRGSEL